MGITFKRLSLAVALAASTFTAATVAEARSYRDRNDDAAIAIGAGIIGLAVGAAIASDNDDRYYYRDRRYYCRRGSGTTGLIVGGAAGALLGREVDRYGDRVPGTIIGGAAGALLGREIDRGGRRC